MKQAQVARCLAPSKAAVVRHRRKSPAPRRLAVFRAGVRLEMAFLVHGKDIEVYPGTIVAVAQPNKVAWEDGGETGDIIGLPGVLVKVAWDNGEMDDILRFLDDAKHRCMSVEAGWRLLGSTTQVAQVKAPPVRRSRRLAK